MSLSHQPCHVLGRSAQQAAEAAAAEESHRLRRLAAQEAMLKETFLEAVEAEKERLLLARQQALSGRPTSAPQQHQVCKCNVLGDLELLVWLQPVWPITIHRCAHEWDMYIPTTGTL